MKKIIIKKIIENAIVEYVKELTSGIIESYKKMTPDEKEMFVKDTEEELDDTVEDLLSDFNPELCVRMYSSYEEFECFMKYKDLYWDYAKSAFEYTYRTMIDLIFSKI